MALYICAPNFRNYFQIKKVHQINGLKENESKAADGSVLLHKKITNMFRSKEKMKNLRIEQYRKTSFCNEKTRKKRTKSILRTEASTETKVSSVISFKQL